MEVKDKVVDVPLYYNIFLGHNWNYTMKTVMSSVFHVL
jgi:hypothetical protein